jgi:ABC-2 type transport system permease protein
MLPAAVATRSFRRYSTYVGATLAGIFTNCVFGVIYSYVYLEIWTERPGAGGYDATDAVTYVWIGQALLMTVAVWGGGSTDDLATRIRSGDVAIDLYRPVSLVGWYLWADLGRAAYHFLTRGLGPTAVGFVVFDIRLPATLFAAAAFLASLVLAVVTSFTVRFLVAGSAFWLLDHVGVRMLMGAAALFFSGMVLPLVIFPEPWRSIALALPFASYLQTPADIWLGARFGTEVWLGLGRQTLWIAALLGCCQLLTRAATRKVVVQGG